MAQTPEWRSIPDKLGPHYVHRSVDEANERWWRSLTKKQQAAQLVVFAKIKNEQDRAPWSWSLPGQRRKP